MLQLRVILLFERQSIVTAPAKASLAVNAFRSFGNGAVGQCLPVLSGIQG
jgi:hypothetical protein